MKRSNSIVMFAAHTMLSVGLVCIIAYFGLLPVNGPALQEYMLSHPQLVEDMARQLRSQRTQQQELAQRRAIDSVGLKAFFDPRIAFVVGPENAKKSLVEFYDYNCAYCRASASAVMKYVTAHKTDVRLALIEFPIRGVQSPGAASVVLAAHRQADKYLALHEALMKEEAVVTESTVYAAAKKAGFDIARLRADAKRPEIAKAVGASRALAKKIGVEGTPTFIINGQFRAGAVDEAMLARLMKG